MQNEFWAAPKFLFLPKYVQLRPSSSSFRPATSSYAKLRQATSYYVELTLTLSWALVILSWASSTEADIFGNFFLVLLYFFEGFWAYGDPTLTIRQDNVKQRQTSFTIPNFRRHFIKIPCVEHTSS